MRPRGESAGRVRGEGGGRRGRAGRPGARGRGWGRARAAAGAWGAPVPAAGARVFTRGGSHCVGGAGARTRAFVEEPGGRGRGARVHAREECLDARVCVGPGACLRGERAGGGVWLSVRSAC